MATKTLIKQTAKSFELEEPDVEFALAYLEYYYVNPDVAKSLKSEDEIKKLTKQFQKMFGLTANGKLDSKTVKAMKYTPRCGCPDYEVVAENRRASSKWGLNELKYYIESYVGGLSKSDQDDLNALAFKQWSDVADLKFTRVKSKSSANLILSTGRGRRYNFDGPSGTLAWAYLPNGSNYRGQLLMRYDLDETWVKSTSQRGILFLNVACHEFGHFLGLGHSSKRGALMAPYYTPGVTKPVANDDISRIQRLYGKPQSEPDEPDPTDPPTPDPTEPGTLVIKVKDAKASDVTVNGIQVVDFSL